MPLWAWGTSHSPMKAERSRLRARASSPGFGVDLTPRTRRICCQPCLDWSERRYHLKGLVGARILARLLALEWLKSVSGSRALQLTSSGRPGFSAIFLNEISDEGALSRRLYGAPRLTV